MKLKNRIKQWAANYKLILIGILLLIAIILIIINLDFRENKSFDIEDKCGKFVNLLSHTIADEGVCKSRCRAQCLSIDYKYSKIKFEESSIGCNECTCFCK